MADVRHIHIAKPRGCRIHSPQADIMKLICLTMILFLWVSPMSTTPSKGVLRVRQKAFDYASQTQRRLLQKAFSNISIPALNQKKESCEGIIGSKINIGDILGAVPALLGKLVNFNEIKILDVKLPKLNVKLVPPVLQLCVDTDIHMSGKHAILGEMELRVSATVLADMRSSKTSKGDPTLAVTDCNAIIRDLDITVEGLLGSLVWAFQEQFRKMLRERLCLSVSDVLVGLNEDFGDTTDIIPIGDDLGLQYALQNPPVVNGGFMDIDISAKYMVHNQVVVLPSGAQEFTLPPGAGNKDAMINVGFSQDYFSSLFKTFQISGGFNLKIPSTYAPLANQLSTSALGSHIPEISTKYPLPLPVDMNIVLSETPVVTFQSNQLIVQISPYVEMFVVVPNSPNRYQHLLTVNVGASLVASLDVKEEKLKPSVSLKGDLNLVFASVSFGPCKCNPSLLSGYMRSVFEKAYLPHINEILSVGVPLPKLPNVRFIHPVVDIVKNYTVMSFDIQYNE